MFAATPSVLTPGEMTAGSNSTVFFKNLKKSVIWGKSHLFASNQRFLKKKFQSDRLALKGYGEWRTNFKNSWFSLRKNRTTTCTLYTYLFYMHYFDISRALWGCFELCTYYVVLEIKIFIARLSNSTYFENSQCNDYILVKNVGKTKVGNI